MTLRNKIHHFVEQADEKKLKAFYVLMKNEIDDSITNLSEDQKTELELRELDFEKNQSTFISSIESKQRIQALLQK